MPVAIIGAGRSGTSMISGMLSRCGLYMGEPDDLLTGDSANRNGYWEHPLARDISQAVLNHLTRKLGSAALAEPGWENDPDLRNCYADAAKMVEYFQCRSSNWGWKYPPASLIIPFWKRAVPDLRFILCMRNPLDVASSSVKLYPFDRAAARNLWLLHTVKALTDTRPQDRAIVFFDRLFPDYRSELFSILDFIGIDRPAQESDLDRALSNFGRRDLKHHDSSFLDVIESAEMPYVVKQLFLEMLTGPRDASNVPILKQRDLFLPILADSVAADAERRHLAEILASRTHRIASRICSILIRSPFGKSSSRRKD